MSRRLGYWWWRTWARALGVHSPTRHFTPWAHGPCWCEMKRNGDPS